MAKENGFLPINKKEMRERGWKQADFVYVCGDAYVDHPSFGAAIITRLLEDAGYKVAFIAQPDWNDENSIAVCGEPRLAFIVSAGNMDSMVNHYSVSKKHRQTDSYTPGGEMGKRPDYAVVVYTIRQVYKDVPVIVGGIEASLRRLAHYDYWSDRVKRSVLMDGGADLISYGMGEHSIVEIADALAAGIDIRDITFVDGTCYKTKNLEAVYDYIMLPSYEEIRTVCYEMESGVSESEAYRRFGERCGQAKYKTFATLLIQNLQKGSRHMGEMLEKESVEAWDDRKRKAKVQGEAATTKLLFPMILMLGVVMAIVMLPACLSFYG